MPLDPQIEQPSQTELVQLCAVDPFLFCKTFFPRTFRQDFAPFHRQMWEFVERPGKRLRMLQVFRGGAKTSFLRALAAKRIAYGISRTILYIGKSEGHAVRSASWLRSQVEFNSAFANTFSLRKGARWSGGEAQIFHGVENHPVWVVAMGITGSVRGLNLDDFRPDLIVLDDIFDEENSATLEQREKVEELVYGALMESLAPESEIPDALMIGLQTPMQREDYSIKAMNDPQWDFMRIGCWTSETEDLPLDNQESAWPARWSSRVLREEKRAALQRNKISLWMREKECKIVSRETSSFKPEWLSRFTEVPTGITHVLSIDPVPPPSAVQVAKNLHNKDYEAISVIGVYGGKYYLREVSINRGHDPGWTVNECFRLSEKYKPRKWIVESLAYQRTLSWLLREAMKAKRKYFLVSEFTDQRSKHQRIEDALTGPASNGALLIPPDAAPEGMQYSEGMRHFVQQFSEYPQVGHDDALDSVAIALSELQERYDDNDGTDEFALEAEHYKQLEWQSEALCP